MAVDDRIPTLTLPKRFEALEREAKNTDADLGRIVQRIDDAASRIETLLRQVRDGGLGRFELVLGKSGSGKTTFFRTLEDFFTGVTVNAIPESLALSEIADYIRNRNQLSTSPSVWVMYDRDNPQVTSEDAYRFFESLRVFFRESAGRIVLCWPITDEREAGALSEVAWNVGRDSIVDLTRGIYHFAGVPRRQYYEIADLTARSLRGQPLEVYGITAAVAAPLAEQSQTIAEYYARLEAKAAELNNYFRDILSEKVVPSVWILVAGDNARDLNLTVATLTQGTQKQVDIDRLLSFLDSPDLDAAYLKEWKKRRNELAFLMRLLDVRVFELPPNVALAAVRAFGADDAKEGLKLKSATSAAAVATIKNAGFFRAIQGDDLGARAYLRSTETETANEYRRLQVRAKSEDKKLNKALAEAIKRALADSSIAVEISSEMQAPKSNLKPDIRIIHDNSNVICLEPTWRSTGAEVSGEIQTRQNTLTVGHIQKYLLEKVLAYVNDLGL